MLQQSKTEAFHEQKMQPGLILATCAVKLKFLSGVSHSRKHIGRLIVKVTTVY